MVLVDTSVWIRFFANRPPYAAEVNRLSELRLAMGHDLVYGELLIGDHGGRRKFLSAYRRMHQTKTIPHLEVVEFVNANRLHGRGLSWIDVHLLASVVAGRLEVWTADQRFAEAATNLGVAYNPQKAAL